MPSHSEPVESGADIGTRTLTAQLGRLAMHLTLTRLNWLEITESNRALYGLTVRRIHLVCLSPKTGADTRI